MLEALGIAVLEHRHNNKTDACTYTEGQDPSYTTTCAEQESGNIRVQLGVGVVRVPSVKHE